jgi:hypothetical protein
MKDDGIGSLAAFFADDMVPGRCIRERFPINQGSPKREINVVAAVGRFETPVGFPSISPDWREKRTAYLLLPGWIRNHMSIALPIFHCPVQ